MLYDENKILVLWLYYCLAGCICMVCCIVLHCCIVRYDGLFVWYCMFCIVFVYMAASLYWYWLIRFGMMDIECMVWWSLCVLCYGMMVPLYHMIKYDVFLLHGMIISLYGGLNICMICMVWWSLFMIKYRMMDCNCMVWWSLCKIWYGMAVR